MAVQITVILESIIQLAKIILSRVRVHAEIRCCLYKPFLSPIKRFQTRVTAHLFLVVGEGGSCSMTYGHAPLRMPAQQTQR